MIDISHVKTWIEQNDNPKGVRVRAILEFNSATVVTTKEICAFKGDLVAVARKQTAESLIEMVKREATRPTAPQWISVKDRLPPKESKVWFWLVPKEGVECPHNTSGKPICACADPYMYACKWTCWPSLMKPTHWMPLPEPPTGTAEELKATVPLILNDPEWWEDMMSMPKEFLVYTLYRVNKERNTARDILRGDGSDRSDRSTIKKLWRLLLPEQRAGKVNTDAVS